MPEYKVTFQANIIHSDADGIDEGATPEQVAGELAAYVYYGLHHDGDTPDKVTVRNMDTGEETELDPEEVVKNAG
jgi:hypothetical protein